jgi:hypothetical protein
MSLRQHHRASRRNTKRIPGDNPLLRRAFEREFELPDRELERRYYVATFQVQLNQTYRDWLRAKGINPDTGEMTPEGLAFFKMLLDEDRSRKTQLRRAS